MNRNSNTMAAGSRPVGEFQGYSDDGEPSVTWFDRDAMPEVGAVIYAVPRSEKKATAFMPRYWSLLLTSENHGTVGPVGATFPHAGERHERVVVVEVVDAGAPPAPGADLTGLIRFNAAGDQVEISDATPVSAPAGQVAVPAAQVEWSHDLQERLIAAGQDFDEHEGVRQVMAEAACLLAALTGVKAPTSGERQEGGAA